MASKIGNMRDSLLQAMEQVRNGQLSPEKAKAMASLAHQVVAALDVELRVMLAAKVNPSRAAELIESAPEKRAIGTGTVERHDGVTRHSMGGE